MLNRKTILVCSLLLLSGHELASQTYRYAKQGFSMRMALDNRGAFGRVSYPGVIGGTDPGGDSIGLEYPIGQPYEHIFGAGLWVGGILDTSTSGPPVFVRSVSTGYEGWIGPYFEFFPGTTTADTVFKVFNQTPGQYPGRYPPKPPGWDDPTGLEGAIPYQPISDADFHVKYTDTRRAGIAGHSPLNLKVFQSSYAWTDPYADAIIIMEYRLVNIGSKRIDSAFVGFFFDADVGPYRVAGYAQRNYTGYYQDSKTAYIHNPRDRGSTPVGCAFLIASRPQNQLTYSFRWWNGPQHPNTDADKYARLSSGLVDSTQSLFNLGDPRCIFGFGAFTLNPSNPPLPGITPDTVKIAIAIVSGFDPAGNHLKIMQRNATRALDIYLNQGVKLPATPPSPPLRVEVGDRKVKLNWLWTPADSTGPTGRPNPVSNWDSTNRRIPDHPTWTGVPGFASRVSPPYPPGIDGSRGGRNFESYRLWRSEHPNHADETFTLLKQWDVAGDTIEFDTGLEYEYVDSNLVRGKRYTYTVTSKSVPNVALVDIVVNGQVVQVPVEVEALESAKSGPSSNKTIVDLPFATSQEAGKVRVVPNPYRTDKDYTYESGGYEQATYDWTENKRTIKFINLPQVCTIRVFSLAGDLIRTIDHDGGGGSFPRGDHNMPLVSESNRALASGVYVFTVESNLGTQVGKFVIIR